MKLTPEQCLLSFITYLKHDNIHKYEFFEWNVTHSPLCSNVIFIASCITNTLAHEIVWLDEVKQWHLSCLNLHFSSCIKIIDGTIVKIQKPWNNPNHARWFNGQKKLYCMKNMVVVSQDLGFSISFHDLTIFNTFGFDFISLKLYVELGTPKLIGHA